MADYLLKHGELPGSLIVKGPSGARPSVWAVLWAEDGTWPLEAVTKVFFAVASPGGHLLDESGELIAAVEHE